MNGLHIIAEFFDCQCPLTLLQQVDALSEVCLDACRVGELTVVAQAFHQFGSVETPAGATGALVLAESHLAIHTWPEWRSVTLDIYVCNVRRDNHDLVEQVFNQLQSVFLPKRSQVRRVERGSPCGMMLTDEAVSKQ